MPVKYPATIFGIHDPGEWIDRLEELHKTGWCLHSVGLGDDPNNNSGINYEWLERKGFGTLVRLNNGYEPNGTIPRPERYDAFAQRCKNFVANSPGAHMWIIGNEMNLAAERPHGQPITPNNYAECYRKVRDAIRSIPGRQDDLVIVGGIGPWNIQTTYAGNERGDWVKYLGDILNIIKPNCDGIAVHAYTHGTDPKLIFSDQLQGAFPQYNDHFRTYRDYMRVIPAELKRVPVFITEAQPVPSPGQGWLPESRGWVTNAYKEINDWNSNPSNQPIQCLLLFRWDEGVPEWSIKDKAWVQDDFIAAAKNDYKIRLPGSVAPPRVARQYRASWLSVNMPAQVPADDASAADFTIKNDSNFVWRMDGSSANPVRLGYRWFDSNGNEVAVREGLRTLLANDVKPGESITLNKAKVIAPVAPGRYTLRWDLVEEGVTWFADAGSDKRDLAITVTGAVSVATVVPNYAVSWAASVPASLPRDSVTNITVTIKNDGAKTWIAAGNNPVRLGFRWFRADNQQEQLVRQLVRVSLPRNVAAGESATLNLPLLSPETPRSYTLELDLIEEGVTEFKQAGAKPFNAPVNILGPNYFASWVSLSQLDSIAANQLSKARAQIRNDGNKTWKSGSQAGSVRLTYRWFNQRNEPITLRQDLRAELPRDMATGDELAVEIPLLTPEQPEVYTLRFDLVEEGVTFFSAQGAPPLDKVVTVLRPEYQVRFLDHDRLAQATSDASFGVNMLLRNEGTRTWRAGGNNPVRAGYRWFNAGGQVVGVRQDIRSELPRDVATGQDVMLAAQVIAPAQAGDYRLQISLVEEGIAWFYDRGANTLDLALKVSGAAEQTGAGRPDSAPATPPTVDLPAATVPAVPAGTPTHRAVFTRDNVPNRVESGAPLIFPVRVRNDGSQTWSMSGNHPVHAGYKWFRNNEQVAAQADVRTALPKDVAPGEEVIFGAQYVTPNEPGQYTLRFDLIEEGITWFADTKTSEPIETTVEVATARSGIRVATSHNNGEAGRIIDGNADSDWSSGQKMEAGMWVQLDLGAPKVIDALKVRSPGRGFPAGYTVQLSTDGVTWVTAGYRPKNWADIIITFAPYATRYIHITQTGETQWNAPWKISEVLLHEATTWQATASHGPELAAFAIDNNPATLWTTGVPQQAGMSFTLDMQTPQVVTGLLLENGDKPQYPQGFVAKLSNDGRTWQTVGQSAEAGNWAPVNLNFNATAARLIHIECTSTNRWHPWSISQLWVRRDIRDEDWKIIR